MWIPNPALRKSKREESCSFVEGAKERLQLVKADLMDEGSFDNAVMGCSGMFHMGSPVLNPSFDPKPETVEPAIQGSLNVLRSCKKNPHLRRVMLTSSSSTVRVREDLDLNVPLDETSWSSVELSCHPSLCSTASDFLGLLKGETKKFQWHRRMGYVHIDDVALCHILVSEKDDDQGRYLCSTALMDNDELVSFLSARYTLLPIPTRFEPMNRPCYEFDTSMVRSLGFEFKPIEQMFDNCVTSLVNQGYISSSPI
ncbi:hypothetical protein MLD38_032280 [Melastoma candidum]|uniref:Uncharacterized protein n=1 Tax=Melastoma candidum TaxID=119954 RepID=A0ACB9M4F9_9MYRT|nr:hypothetical protein MLD38_032280 [Melastoma candidum]